MKSTYPLINDQTASDTVQLLNGNSTSGSTQPSTTSSNTEMLPLLATNNEGLDEGGEYSYASAFAVGGSFEILEPPTLSPSDSFGPTCGTSAFIREDCVLQDEVALMAAPSQRPSITSSLVSSTPNAGRPGDYDMEAPPPSSDEGRMVASGVAGAVVGSLIFGPFLGAMVGFGAAYSTRTEGAAGDIGRALGDIALMTRDKAGEIEREHRLVQKGKDALSAGWDKAKEMDRKHHILEKVKDYLAFCWTETVDFTRRHRLLERGVHGVGKGIEWFFVKVFSATPATIDDDARRSYEGERADLSS